MAVQLETREVQVQQVNGHGFKSTAGDWLNVSKYAHPSDVEMPRVGERVTVTLDRSGFVRKVEAVAMPAKVIDQAELRTKLVRNSAPAPASVTPEGDSHNVVAILPTIVQDAKGMVILRINVMTTATAIMSSGGGATTPEEVLKLAARLEAWATRG